MQMVTREDIEAEQADSEFVDLVVELIETDDRVRAAILALTFGAPKAPTRQKRPTTMTPMRRGRGR